MAKSSMGGSSAPPASAPPVMQQFTQLNQPMMKRPRIPEAAANVDTVASVGAAEQGIDEATLHNFFSSQPGFITFKSNPRMGGGFSKFESASAASEAIAAAQDQGIPAALAKSSMST